VLVCQHGQLARLDRVVDEQRFNLRSPPLDLGIRSHPAVPANSIEGHINIELINWPFLQEHRGSNAGLDLAIERGWPRRHESGTYLKFTDSGAALFA
jgi:hypothetical protein